MRLCPLDEREALLKRLGRLSSIAQHHEVADLQADRFGNLRGLQDGFGRDPLADVVQDRRRAGLHAQAQALTACEP